jgi:predicted ATPase/class 3 adenylate cyclase
VTSRNLPTGEVTFLFTDIEGSTRLLSSLGTSGWRPILERHREIVRGALAAHAGREFGTEGDALFAVFQPPDPEDRAGARDAVLTAVDAQRALAAEPWPEEAVIRVRMGVHSGIGELDSDGGYVGHDVHRAARIASAGHGGQILLSETTSHLVTDHLPAGIELRPLGAHRLKDLRPEQISQLVIEGLPADFPPIRSLDARPNNLPTELSSFVGREREIAATRKLLEQARLVTLTGPGGTGKTRLALQVAASVADRFPDGTWFVPLSAVSDAELVSSAIAHAVGVAEDPARAPLDALVARLQAGTVLLVLDNVEQVLAAAPDIAALLRRAPNVRILATSRAPLRISGEHDYPVPGLPSPVDMERIGLYELEQLPETLRRRDPESLARFEAVDLFVSRGRAVRPDFTLTGANAGDVAAIVAHLSGVPLAIELAAARLRFLTPAAIHERLEGQLDLPGVGAADVPERQRSLRAAIEWSHDLLEPPASRLFERLAVFVDGFDLPSAEGVVGSRDELGADVLDGLASLVDQSLVRSGETAGAPRFSLLEPIREYALERLVAAGDADMIRERHARAFLALATEVEPRLAGADQRAVLDRLEHEHANVRAAIDWADAARRPELALGIVAAVWRFWQKRGHLREARARVSTLIGRPWFATAPPPLRARTHEAMGGIIYWHGDLPAARPEYEAALAIWRELGDRAEIANALYNLSFCYSMLPLADASTRATAASLLDEALSLYRALGDERGTANVLWGIGTQQYFSNENDPAARTFAEALQLYRRVGDRTQEAWALHQLGSSHLKLGNVDLAREEIRQALQMFDGAGDIAGVTVTLDDMSAVAVAEGDLHRAARLQGLARRLQASSGTGLAGLVLDAFESATRPLAANAMDPGELARYLDEGAALPLADGVRYALEEEPPA